MNVHINAAPGSEHPRLADRHPLEQRRSLKLATPGEIERGVDLIVMQWLDGKGAYCGESIAIRV